MNRLFIVITLLFFSQTSLAKNMDDWYEVEIIFFEHLDASALEAEQWPGYPGQPNKVGSIELTHPTALNDDNSPTSKTNSTELTHEPSLNTGTEPASPVQSAIDEETAAIDHAETGADPSPKEPAAYEILAKDLYQLNEKFDILAAAKQYRPILHLAWRQIVPNRQNPDHIHLFSGENTPTQEEGNTHILENTPALSSQISEITPLPDHLIEKMAGTQDTHTTHGPAQLDGVLTLSRGRYLHVDADFIWRNPYGLAERISDHIASHVEQNTSEIDLTASSESLTHNTTNEHGALNLDPSNEPLLDIVTQEQPPQDIPYVSPGTVGPEAFRIQGRLRLRSGEIHYLDHPMVSMLILFTPYAPPMDDVVTDTVETFGVAQ